MCSYVAPLPASGGTSPNPSTSASVFALAQKRCSPRRQAAAAPLGIERSIWPLTRAACGRRRACRRVRNSVRASLELPEAPGVPLSLEPVLQVLAKLGVQRVDSMSSVGGGSINACYTFQTAERGPVFCKVNETKDVSMFRAEYVGLQAIRATDSITAPVPLALGSLQNSHASGGSFLLMEHLDLLRGAAPAEAQVALGTALALPEREPAPEGHFGFFVDNTIGSTPQTNAWTRDWAEFFAEQRLGPMVKRVARRFKDEDVRRRGQRLADRLPSLMAAGGPIRPALIHGDLWFGNAGSLSDGRTPVLFDPCPYFAHSEMELGIAQLFGGFSRAFFDAYHELIPKAGGFEERGRLYGLYHLLNHAHLFGFEYYQDSLCALQDLTS